MSILLIVWDIASYLSNIADFNLHHLYLALSLGAIPFEFAEICGTKI